MKETHEPDRNQRMRPSFIIMITVLVALTAAAVAAAPDRATQVRWSFDTGG